MITAALHRTTAQHYYTALLHRSSKTLSQIDIVKVLKSSIPYEVGSTSFKVDSGSRKGQVHREQGVVVMRPQVFLLVRTVPVGCQLGYKTSNNLNCKLQIYRSWHNGRERNFKTRGHGFNSWQKFSFPLSVLETDPDTLFGFWL